MKPDYAAEDRERERLAELHRFSLRKAFCNVRVLAVVAGHFAHNWFLYTLLSWLPTYISDQLGASVGRRPHLAHSAAAARRAAAPSSRASRTGRPDLCHRLHRLVGVTDGARSRLSWNGSDALAQKRLL